MKLLDEHANIYPLNPEVPYVGSRNATSDGKKTYDFAVMVTPESCLEWAHNCAEARAVGDGSFHDRLAYSATDMPWPVSDRDYVLRLTTEGEQSTGVLFKNRGGRPAPRKCLISATRGGGRGDLGFAAKSGLARTSVSAPLLRGS